MGVNISIKNDVVGFAIKGLLVGLIEANLNDSLVSWGKLIKIILHNTKWNTNKHMYFHVRDLKNRYFKIMRNKGELLDTDKEFHYMLIE